MPAGPAGDAGDGVGIPLYIARRVVVKCYADGRHATAGRRSGFRLERVAAAQEFCAAGGGRRRAAVAALPPSSLARRRPGNLGRVCHVLRRPGLGQAAACWPIPTTCLDNRPAVVPFGSDGVLAVYSSDYRLRGAHHNADGKGRGR